jgi:hypothetical protein
MVQLSHHLISVICKFGLPLCVFCNVNSLSLSIIHVIIYTIAQSGWLYNDDDCFLTTAANVLIDPDRPNRIWRADLSAFIKHYIQGDEWAYKDIYNKDKTGLTLFVNILLLLHLIKLNGFN